jgi:hypothetical protein
MIKSYLRKLRKRLLGGDLCDVVAMHDRDVRILAKQIGDLVEQVRQLSLVIDRTGRELTYVAVDQVHLAAHIRQLMSDTAMKEANGDVAFSRPAIQQASVQLRICPHSAMIDWRGASAWRVAA